MKTSVLLLLVATALMGQPPSGVTTSFTWQAAAFGPLHLYAANVCNTGSATSTVQAYRDVWPAARAINLQIQTPTAIREVQRSLEASNWPKWILWGLAGGCAITSGVTHGGVVALDPNKGLGKAVAYGASGCAVGLPIIAERWTGKPGGDQQLAPDSEMLPATFVLAAGDCKQGLVYVIPPLGLKVLP